MRLIIISGLSGSGKSTAARALEDDGFFVVDNLPPSLLRPFLQTSSEAGANLRNLAVVIDARNRAFLTGFSDHLAEIEDAGHQVEILFFEASDETLQRRYSETRRRHPLAGQGGVAEGIAAERRLLAGVRKRATALVDSDGLTPHQLRARVVALVRHEEPAVPLAVHLQSFGFRYGIPTGSDLVMDVRFLPNPHFDPHLQPLSGLDREVQNYVLESETGRAFLPLLENLLGFLLPQYRREGKSYLTISIGCTGGRHRSVAVVTALAGLLAYESVALTVTHRDVEKG